MGSRQRKGQRIYRIEGAKRDLAHTFSFSKSHLCPLQLLFYALEISLSIMELQGPEFLITRTFLLHARVDFDAPSWKVL